MVGWMGGVSLKGCVCFMAPPMTPLQYPPHPSPRPLPSPFIQVVAYTTSSLHVEMLRIFCDVRCRLPNVVVGFITRASVRRAMASGALRVF